MIRASLYMTGGRTLTSILRFVRNILLARLLSVEDYGIASTFMVAIAFVEMVSGLGLDRLIVQDKEGGEKRFVAAVQSLAFLRGVLLAGLMFALAGPTAALFGHPELIWAYQAFAIVPFLRSLAHLDMMREQREMRFRVQTLADLGSVAVSLACLYPLIAWLGNFRVLLVIIVIDMIVRSLLSHLLAERSFALGWDKAVIRRAMKFGWPLLISGTLSFLILQGDRIVIATEFTARDLGIFSAALTLGMTPTLLAASIMQSFFLPFLSKVQSSQEGFERRVIVTMQAHLWLAGVSMLCFAIIGPDLFVLVFGERYAEGAIFCALIGMAFSLRLLRAGPTTVAVSKGFTVNLLLANLPRLFSLFVAYVRVAYYDGTVITVLIISILGELASYVVAVALLKYKLSVGTDRMLVPFLISSAISFLCLWIIFQGASLLSVCTSLVLFASLVVICKEARTGVAAMRNQT